MPTNGNDHATKLDISVLEGRFDKLEGWFDGLEGRFDKLESRFDGLEGHVDGLDGTVRRIALQVANLTGDVAELKERIPPSSYFSKLMTLMDGMARSLEDQGQRLAGQAVLWQELHGMAQGHGARLEDHEQRISRLES